MDVSLPSYTVTKHTDSGYALVSALSLPYEGFAESSGSVVPAPYPGVESQLTDIITVAATTDPDLQGYLEVYNELTVPLRMTAADLMPYTSDDSFGEFRYQFGPGGNDQAFSSYLETAVGWRSVQTAAGIPIALEAAAGPLVGTMRLLRSNFGKLTAFNCYFEYSPSPNLWVAAATPVVLDDITAGGSFSVPINAIALRLRVEPIQPIVTQLSVDFKLEPDSGQYRFPQRWSTLFPARWPFLSSLPQCDAFRRIGQDMLFTYTGSTLENGGQISGALVPVSFVPIAAATPFDAVASLRVNRMDGPVKFGSHVTWRQNSLQEIDRLTFDTYSPAVMKMVCGFYFDDAKGSARLRTFGMFGLTSNNPIIGRQIWTPAITDPMKEALSLYYQSYPCATSNEKHKALKLLKAGGKAAGKMISRLLEQDDKLAALALAAGQPELAAAVKTAGAIHRGVKSSKKKVAVPKTQPAKKKK
jgi:hypothetical protein